MPTVTGVAALDVRNVSKTFDGITVLDSVTMTIAPGEIVGLIGQNGSGKSTFIKVLSGFHHADPGAQVMLGERDATHALHEHSSKTGLAFIHQDLALVESMTILENLRIGQFQTGLAGRIRWRDEAREVRRILSLVDLDVDPQTEVSELSVTEKALVVIARGLVEIESGEGLDARTLVLDEPTAYLPSSGVERLFSVVRRLADGGTSILFVSHRLDEVLQYCDRAVVFRGGKLVADVETAGRTERDLVHLMLGQAAEDLYPEYGEPGSEVALAVDDLAGGAVGGVGFEARTGEIIGFIGLPGSGYDEVPYLLAGAQPSSSGTVRVREREYRATSLSSRRAAERGFALLPADRKGSSGATGLTVGENLTIPTLGRFARGGVLSHRRERITVAEQLTRFGVTPPDGGAGLASLSGGNQQKVLIAKWAFAEPDVLLLHEPTQGVDVGAKRDVFAHLARLAASGAVVVVSSVEYEDLASLCTTVHVMRGGRIVRSIAREHLTAHELAAAVYER